jgi:hypothetical protein
MWLVSVKIYRKTGCPVEMNTGLQVVGTYNLGPFEKSRPLRGALLASWVTIRIADRKEVFWQLGHDKNRRQKGDLLVSLVTTRIADKWKVFW